MNAPLSAETKPPCDCCRIYKGQWINECSCMNVGDAQRVAVWCAEQNDKKAEPLSSKKRSARELLESARGALRDAGPVTQHLVAGWIDEFLRQPVETPAVRPKRIAEEVVQMVSDMDDRTSPEDQPEMMLVAGAELHDFILLAFERAAEKTAEQYTHTEVGACLIHGEYRRTSGTGCPACEGLVEKTADRHHGGTTVEEREAGKSADVTPDEFWNREVGP